ncbi:MAG TPA: nucleoside diphosphate kinase regulator [Telluria sp.]
MLLDSLPPLQSQTLEGLLDELSRAEIVEPQDMPSNVVTMNSRVRFAIDKPEQEFSLTLAYPKDIHGADDQLSVLSPVGNALLGLSIGDRMEWMRPDGALFEVTVLDVLYQPERAGALHR